LLDFGGQRLSQKKTGVKPEGGPMLSQEKQTALDWIKDNHRNLSDWNQTIWNFAEPAWREYKSAEWYVERLRAEGFDV